MTSKFPSELMQDNRKSDQQRLSGAAGQQYVTWRDGSATHNFVHSAQEQYTTNNFEHIKPNTSFHVIVGSGCVKHKSAKELI